MGSNPCLSQPHPVPPRTQGFGWAIAKALAEAGCEISLGVWVRRGRQRLTICCSPGHSLRLEGAWITACDGRQGPRGVLTWTPRPQVPALNIFETSYRRGKFDESRKLSNGKMMEFSHIYPMDAVFDTPADVPEDVSMRMGATCQHGSSVCMCQRAVVVQPVLQWP